MAEGQELIELCDGGDLGGASCATIGFASGTLACNARCQFDTAQCESCIAGSHITRCIHPSTDGDAPAQLALAAAANGSEVAAVWLAKNYGNAAPGLHFARFRPDLSLIAETASCVGPANPIEPAATATTSGWLVALASGSDAAGYEIHLLSFDQAGAFRGDRTVASGVLPALIPDSNGGALLAWANLPASGTSFTTVHAESVDTSGAATGPIRTVFANGSDHGYFAGSFVGDGFLFAVHVYPDPDHEALQLLHMDRNGGISSGASVGGSQFGPPSLAWTGSEARLTYEVFFTTTSGSRPGTFWRRTTGSGSLMGDAVLLDDGNNAYGAFAIASLANDSVVLKAPNFGEIDSLDIVRVTGAGALSAAIPVAREAIGSPALLALGNAVVVGWVGIYEPGVFGEHIPGRDRRLGLALVAP
jgi:hypothetical protein